MNAGRISICSSNISGLVKGTTYSIKGRGWSLPAGNGLEVDQYDDNEAIYFLDVGDENRIQGAIRITPTIKSSLIADYLPDLVENGELPRSPTIYECTRYIVISPRKSRDDNRQAKSRIIGAMLDWCNDHELTYLQTIIDSAALPTYLDLTSLTIPLGLSHPYGGGRKTPGGGEWTATRWPMGIQVYRGCLPLRRLCERRALVDFEAPAFARGGRELVH